MVDTAVLTMVKDIVTILGVIGGFTYYVMTIHATQKNQTLTLKAQEHALETRGAQLFMHIYQQLNTIESQKTWAELLNMQWNSLEDFRNKYDSLVNLENWGKRGHIWWSYSSIDHILKKGLIDPDLVYRTLGPMITRARQVDLEGNPLYKWYLIGFWVDVDGSFDCWSKDLTYREFFKIYGSKNFSPNIHMI